MAVLPPPIIPTTRPSTGARPLIDLLEERDGVDHLPAIHGRDVEMVRDLRADRDEYGVEAALLPARRARR